MTDRATDKTTILLVGHCIPDSFGLTRMAKQVSAGTQVERVNNDKALQKRLGDASLLLVNRELDGRFEAGDMGVELIRRLRAEGVQTPMMLVSNFEDAQQAAVEAGALPGFGKSDVRDPATVERLRAAIGVSQSAT